MPNFFSSEGLKQAFNDGKNFFEAPKLGKRIFGNSNDLGKFLDEAGTQVAKQAGPLLMKKFLGTLFSGRELPPELVTQLESSNGVKL